MCDMDKKKQIYDELCKVLTDFENPSDVEDYNYIDWKTELYEMLVKIQNSWENIITVEE